MAGQVFASPDDGPPPARPRRAAPVVGAVAAAAVSVGLIWWMAPQQSPESPAPPALRPPAAPRAPPPKAGVQPDRAQVQRAFDEVQDAYADGGPEGLARADADCAAALKADGRVLDYCLAFDLFATAVAPAFRPAGDAEAARLAQARTALPAGADPAARLSAVRAMMRETSLGGGAAQPRAAPRPQPVRVVTAPAPHRVPTAAREARRRQAASAMQASFAWRAADPCLGPTMAERLACGHGARSRPAPGGARAVDPVAQLLAGSGASEEAPH